MDILVTCPPMIAAADMLADVAANHGFHLVCPDVVQTLSEDELCDLVPSYIGWIIGDDPATQRVFEEGKRGKLRSAVKWGIGIDNVDFEAASRFGIPISNTPNMFGAEVADLAMCYVTSLARHTTEVDRGVRNLEWPKPVGVSLSRKTLGLIGLGDIGRNLARRAGAADMQVVGYDPFVSLDIVPENVEVATWPEQIDRCDFLAFTCGLNDSNRHMLNKDTLAMAKRGVRVVNVARGPLICEADLESALADGQVSAAALDVFESEPLPAGSRLRQFENCIFGSHNGSNTIDAVLRASEQALSILRAQLASLT